MCTVLACGPRSPGSSANRTSIPVARFWKFHGPILKAVRHERQCVPIRMPGPDGLRYVMRMLAHWEHFPHGADIGVRGVGVSKAEAFEQAALATAAVVADLATVEAQERVTIECQAPDDELLLVDWLNGLICEMSSRKMLFSRFAVRFEGSRLHGQAWGERADPARHEMAVEVKGATYTALRVGRAKGLWIAETVLDV